MRIFVTYAHQDIVLVRAVVEVFVAAGHVAWFDDQLLPGQDWKKALHDEIARCDAFAYALSMSSVTSEWCEWEYATAIGLGKAILPILLADDVSLPQSLSELQYADLRLGLTPVAAAKLLGALALMQTIPTAQGPAVPHDPKGIPSRAWGSFAHWTDKIVPSQHEQQSEAERICGKFSANLYRGWVAVGGRIIVTNRRLLFEAHRFNARGEPLDIDLREILSIEPSWNLGVVPNAFTVTLRSGDQYQFVVWNRKRIIALIDQLRRSLV